MRIYKKSKSDRVLFAENWISALKRYISYSGTFIQEIARIWKKPYRKGSGVIKGLSVESAMREISPTFAIK